MTPAACAAKRVLAKRLWAIYTGGAPSALGQLLAAKRGRAVAFARRQLGEPYVWGASGPGSYDCSGLMMAAYRSAGVWLPRVSRAPFHAGPGSAWAASLAATWSSSPTPANRSRSTTSACTSATAP